MCERLLTVPLACHQRIRRTIETSGKIFIGFSGLNHRLASRAGAAALSRDRFVIVLCTTKPAQIDALTAFVTALVAHAEHTGTIRHQVSRAEHSRWSVWADWLDVPMAWSSPTGIAVRRSPPGGSIALNELTIMPNLTTSASLVGVRLSPGVDASHTGPRTCRPAVGNLRR